MFELVINLKADGAFGPTIAPAILGSRREGHRMRARPWDCAPQIVNRSLTIQTIDL